MADDISSLFKSLTLNDVRVDTHGNIRIASKDLARKLADRKGGVDAEALSDSLNTGTCNNTACFAPGLDQLSRVNPAARG